MTDIRHTTETRDYNSQFYAVSDQVGVLNDRVKAQMDDPSLRETVRAQQSTTADGLADLRDSAVLELLASAGGKLGFAFGAIGPFKAIYDLGSKLVQANEDGAALANARARDAMHLAILNLGSAELPQGFVQQRAGLLGASEHGAGRILAQLHASGKHAELKASTEAFMARGMKVAQTLGIKDTVGLARARQDKAFEADFRNNPAFRMGAEATIYLATTTVQSER